MLCRMASGGVCVSTGNRPNLQAAWFIGTHLVAVAAESFAVLFKLGCLVCFVFQADTFTVPFADAKRSWTTTDRHSNANGPVGWSQKGQNKKWRILDEDYTKGSRHGKSYCPNNDVSSFIEWRWGIPTLSINSLCSVHTLSRASSSPTLHWYSSPDTQFEMHPGIISRHNGIPAGIHAINLDNADRMVRQSSATERSYMGEHRVEAHVEQEFPHVNCIIPNRFNLFALHAGDTYAGPSLRIITVEARESPKDAPGLVHHNFIIICTCIMCRYSVLVLLKSRILLPRVTL